MIITRMIRGPLRRAVLWSVFCSAPAAPHPHLFIDVAAKFMITDSTLSMFNVFWDMDEMYSASLIEEFDCNGNNLFERDEYKKIERNAFAYALRSGLFIVFTWGKEMLQVNRTEGFAAVIQPNKKVRYSFSIPCNLPLADLEGKEIVVYFSDPSIFIAFDVKKELIQVSTNSLWQGAINFRRKDYSDLIVLTIGRKQ